MLLTLLTLPNLLTLHQPTLLTINFHTHTHTHTHTLIHLYTYLYMTYVHIYTQAGALQVQSDEAGSSDVFFTPPLTNVFSSQVRCKFNPMKAVVNGRIVVLGADPHTTHSQKSSV